MATVIDGAGIAKAVKAEVKEEVTHLREQHGIEVGLGVVLVGSRADSASYVRMKRRSAETAGIKFTLRHFEETATQDEVIAAVEELNNDDTVHGILVQLPLPEHMNESTVIQSVKLEKDVDAFDPQHLGRLALRDPQNPPLFLPCTASGVCEILHRLGVDVAGKHAVVVGRSKLVGLPVSLMLLNRNATVTVCHSRTVDIERVVSQADILVVAVGRPQWVRGEWIKQGAIVIDVGINSVDDESAARGYRLVGDVNFAEAKERASYITPVPGGVGPMTYGLHATCPAEVVVR